MNDSNIFRIVLIKPSKYAIDGYVERFGKGFMPNSTLLHLKSMIPPEVCGLQTEVRAIDEYIETDLRYLMLLHPEHCSLLVLVGVQSHQMHRAIDLAAQALANGVSNCVIGGPHVMTCDTSELQNRGLSFALAEAELVFDEILTDAARCQLRPVYGERQRWQGELQARVLVAPRRSDLNRYVLPMVGLYPARGCPYSCNFCSVVKIAGRQVRGQQVQVTLDSLLVAKRAGVRLVMFTSDNFNKYAEAKTLLKNMIAAHLKLPFFVQCDVQLQRDQELVELLSAAGCAQVFVGVESFDRKTLKAARKFQNDPSAYADLIQLCSKHGISTHFSNIIGFPEQGEAEIRQHVQALREMRPFMASFYVLTPIPGTDQYEDFLSKGLILEENLDRFDATCLVWRHPHLNANNMQSLLFGAYHDFYSPVDVVTKMLERRWNAPWNVHVLGLGYAAMGWTSPLRKMHPMAGGISRVRLDSDGDYRHLRKKRFGVDLLAMPKSLTLSKESDRALSQGPLATLN